MAVVSLEVIKEVLIITKKVFYQKEAYAAIKMLLVTLSIWWRKFKTTRTASTAPCAWAKAAVVELISDWIPRINIINIK